LRASPEFVTIFVVRGIASIAMAFTLAIACSGCFAGGAVGAVATVAPAVAAGSAQIIGAQAGMKDANGGETAKENPDVCDQLLRVPPGVEEVRKTRDGVIESRQFKVTESAGRPTWQVVRADGAPDDAWQPKPGITKLLFNPPLYEMLKPEEPKYLAYAPADVVNIADSEKLDSMTTAFGAGIGTFVWRDRKYSYVLVKELPCFKPPKEK
jgi:hypothetical protein